MERIRNLNSYQKGILVSLILMAMVFMPIYGAVISRMGYLYQEQLLEQGMENGNTVYRAEVQGELWCFTVTPDKTVTFRCGSLVYGPYTAKEDPTAVPKDHNLAEAMTGIEVMDKEDVIFRGGIVGFGERGSARRSWMLYNEDGTSYGFTSHAVMGDGTVIGGDGEAVDPMKPTVYTVLRMMAGPELSHRGDWLGWIAGVFISLITAFTILFADEIFRWNLVLRVRNADLAEPSDWEIAGRYMGWTLLTVTAFVIYIVGLQ